MSERRRTVIGLMLVVAAGCLSQESRADRIVLRGGGQVRGKIVADPKTPDRVNIVLERGKTPMNVEKARVVEVIEEPGPLDAYVVRLRAAAQTASAQFDLGLFCEQNHLPDLAEHHYEAALRLDKSFGPAHEKLGHAQVRGQWLSGDELREAQGLVKYKGKWVTTEEKAQQDKRNASTAEQSSWARRIKVWREAIVYGPEDRRREAETQFMAIREPAAVAPLVKVLGQDHAEMRGLLAKSLALIPGPESATALARFLVEEEEQDVRGTIMDEIVKRQDPEFVQQFVLALRSKSPEFVNRAAWGLANLNAITKVPNLVAALITTRTRVVMAPPPGANEGGSIGAVFGGGGLPGPGLSPVPIAYNGSSIAYMTPPVVAPGAVAFGAYSVPAYPWLNPMLDPTGIYSGYNPNIGVGGYNTSGGLAASRGPVPRTLTESIQNTEVLAALVKLTGQDFGYNVDVWRQWLRKDFKPDPTPARRVPQP